MEMRQFRWQRTEALAKDYVEHFSRVRELFGYDPLDPDAWTARAEKIAAPGGERAERTAVAAALERYNRKIGNAPEALEMIRHIRDGAPVVVGGQQAGLFTGQLMVMYKAISIIKAARRATEKLGKPVVPVFWIAGEDHDHAEVNHLYVPNQESQPERIQLPETGGAPARIPVSRLRIGADQWEHVLEQLKRTLPETEFKPGLVGELRALCEKAGTLSELFAAMMARFFGRYGLVLLDSDDPQLRRVEAPFFRALVRNNGELAEALAAGRERVTALGYEPSADVRDDSANLFWVRGEERLLLYRDGDRFVDRSGSAALGREELLEMAAARPEALSNNVFTRPLMQEFLFPVLAVVLGPGEIAYWALIRQAFERFGMEMPPIVPRLEFTVVEGPVQKLLDKFGLSFEEAVLRLEQKRAEWIRAQDALGVEELFADVRRRFEALYEPVLQTAAQINPGLRQLGETNRKKILEQIAFMESRSLSAFEQQFEAANRQFERIRNSLTPLGKKQERVYNVLTYLNKYGEDWLSGMMRLEPEWNGLHNVVYM